MHGYFVISVFLKIGWTTNHDLLIMNGVIQEQCGLAPCRRGVCSLSAFTFSWPDPCFTHLVTRWRTARAISSLCMSLLSMGLQSKWFLFFEVSTWSLGISDHTCVCSQSARCDGWPHGNYLTDSTSLLVSSADPCQLWPSQHLSYPSNWASHVRFWGTVNFLELHEHPLNTLPIQEGNCCPNADDVILGCCNGFPKTLEQVGWLSGCFVVRPSEAWLLSKWFQGLSLMIPYFCPAAAWLLSMWDRLNIRASNKDMFQELAASSADVVCDTESAKMPGLVTFLRNSLCGIFL